MNDLYDERTDAEVSRRINSAPFMTYKEECESLREQVEKLTKERDEALERERNCAIATHRKAYCIQQCASIIGPDTSATIDGLPKAVKRVTEKLAALAEQNERQKEALLYVMRATVLAYDDKPNSPIGWVYKVASDAYELPNHATPVMNRIRAAATATVRT